MAQSFDGFVSAVELGRLLFALRGRVLLVGLLALTAFLLSRLGLTGASVLWRFALSGLLRAHVRTLIDAATV